jgi:hypothetical protein
MTKKLLLLALLFLNFATIPSFADDQISELISTGSIADILIDLPEDLPAGYHSTVVEVTDPETGEVTEENIIFCKNKTGEIHWDNICPDLDIVVDPATLEEVKEIEDLPIYNPETELEKTADTQVAGFTALSVLSAGGAAVGAAVGGGMSAGGSGGGGSGGGGSGGGGSGGGGSGGGGSGGGGSGGGGSDGGGKSGSGSRSGASARRDNYAGPGESAAGEEDSYALRSEDLTSDDFHHTNFVKQSNDLDFSVIEFAAVGIGDRSITWRAPLTDKLDSAIIGATLRVSSIAPLLGKILNDAIYLRAMFGSLSFLSVPIGIFLGFQALISNNQQPMPPSWQIFSAMAALSIFEAFGGLVAALFFAVGVLISGNANSLNEILTVLAISAMCVSPSILAGSFRPFRRRINQNENLWERGIDYLLAAILTHWTFVGFINSLNVIAAKQLAITGHASRIGFVIGAGVILRMVLEDLATYLYPARSSKFALNPPKPSKRQQYISNVIKAFIFGLVMESFIGAGIPLIIGTLLFILPNILKLSIGNKLPQSRIVHFTLPKGGVRIVVMTLLGTLFAKLSENIFKNPEDFLTWGFVLLSIPGLVIAILGLLSDDKSSMSIRNHKIGLFIYRFGGLIILYLIIQIAIGRDIIEVIRQIPSMSLFS